VDRGTRAFWLLIVALLGASAFFSWNVTAQRALAKKAEATLATGDVVQVERVVDGDSVVVTTPSGDAVGLRLLGIKAFETSPARDPAARWGNDAIDALTRATADRPLRVALGPTPKDKSGRYLATLYADDEDLALMLVKRGLALTYTVYPFPLQSEYLREQAGARAGRTGFWGDAVVVQRADLLVQQWRRSAE
jgi:micrococcal nuclease